MHIFLLKLNVRNIKIKTEQENNLEFKCDLFERKKSPPEASARNGEEIPLYSGVNRAHSPVERNSPSCATASKKSFNSKH